MVTDLANAAHSTRARDAWWDNARGLAVLLVVVGHAVQPATDSSASADWLYRLIYLFHVPLLVLVTGYLTAELTHRRAGRLVTALVVPYLAFELVQWGERTLTQGHPAHLDLLVPGWTLWYLPAVVAWRLAAPMLRAVRPGILLAGSVVVSIAAGLGHGVTHTLALDDVLTYLPFFVAGLVLREAPVRAWLDARGARVAALTTVALAAAATWLTRGRLGTGTFQLDGGNADWGTSDLRGSVVRFGLLLAGAALVAAVLTLVPRGRSWLTGLGLASLFVYLLHAPVLDVLRRTSLLDGVTSWWQTALVALAAAGLAAVLATRLVRAATRWAVEPPIERYVLRGGAAGTGHAADPQAVNPVRGRSEVSPRSRSPFASA
ncbi:acyltransferase family protein [Cellulomonas alba]|uniref:Acyltransferase family protein n=1 Tax=Cellulomonas alba TaxID=3053467 RepID=A0ABT7SCY4_9CELL|nr:acyltransferase family protein [Cellulomonas alba]MDM7854047.1 acyltransferase family protein [Cellulomonas alba]